MNAKKVFLIWLFGQLTVTAFAGSRMTVDQLNQLITSNSDQRDIKIADRLFGLELTERLSASRLAAMERSLPGPESRRALVALADQSVFLDPPLAEIPKQPTPSFEQQRTMIAKTVDYVTAMLHRMPNFYAVRDTIHFEDTPPGLITGVIDGGNMIPAQPLRPVSRSSVTVLYRDGQEVVQAAGKEQIASTAPAQGLNTFGEYGPILATVLSDLPLGKLAWSHWEQSTASPVAVFSFAVPKTASHYQVRFCCVGSNVFQQSPGYHGEIIINPTNGSVLRLTLIADLRKDDPIAKANLMVEYGPVELGGQRYFCPIKSVSVSLAPEFSRDKNAKSLSSFVDALADSPLQTMLNEVVFGRYHLFRSEARILTGASAETTTSTRAADASALTAAADVSTAHQETQALSAAENPAPAATLADVAVAVAPSKPSPAPVAPNPAVPSTPEISFVAPSDLLSAQAGPNPEGYSLRVSTRLVNISVTAYDQKGRPITDLVRDDFVISDNGKKQGIRSFSRACAEQGGLATSTSADKTVEYSNRQSSEDSEKAEGDCPATSPTVILLDATGLGVSHVNRVREQILKFLDRLSASESVGLYVRAGDGFRVLAEGTANHGVLISVLRGWMPDDQELTPMRMEAPRNRQLVEAAQSATMMNYMNGTIGGNSGGTKNVTSVWEIPGGGSGMQLDPKLMTEASERTRRSLSVVGAVAAHMGSIPGHKNLVWLAGNSVLADWTEQMAGSSNGSFSLANAAMRTQETLNDARVSLYPLDASQIEAAAIDSSLQNDSVKLNPTVFDTKPGGSLDDSSTLTGARSNVESGQTPRSVHGAFEQMAEATGGRSFSRSEDVAASLIHVVEDGEATYLMSFTPGSQPDDKYHRLDVVSPTRKGISLHYRAGYLYAKEPTTLKDRFTEAIWQPLDSTEIGIRANRTAASSGAAVSLKIAAADIGLAQQGDRRTGKLDIFLVQRDLAGRRADLKEQTLALDLKAATYERILREGIPFDQYLDDKENSGVVRIIVVDENSGRIGSVTLPAAKESAKP